MLLPTIHFPGNCNEAIEFYKGAFGAKVKDIAYAKDAPPDSGMDLPPDFVMHSEIFIFGTLIGMTDGAEKQITGENLTFTLLLDTDEGVTGVFNRLADGGKIIEALAPQFWCSLNGTVEDRFGVNWNIGTRTK